MDGWRRRRCCRLAERLGERFQHARRPEQPRCVELSLSRVGRADEIRMIGVREPIRLGAHLGDDAPFLEPEHGVDDSGRQEVALDLLPPLRVGAGMGCSLLHLEPHLLR